MHAAAAAGHVEAVKYLLSFDEIIVNSVDKVSESICARECALYYLSEVTLRLPLQYLSTPFFLAARNNHPSVIDVLLERPDVEVDTLTEVCV